MTKKRAIYAGSFDPFTSGHHDILTRSLKIFDEVIVLLAISPTKKPMFSAKQRIEMLKDLFAGDKRVIVDSCNELIIDYAKRNKIGTLIRGLRPTGDFDSESQMASMNSMLYPEIETIFLMTSGKYYFVSSSMVKELFKWGGDVRPFLPKEILAYIKKR